jgi:hypothetical protein
MVDAEAWFCAHGHEEFLYFPDSGRVLPATSTTLRSFHEDASFFTRWHPLKPSSNPKPFNPDVVVALRERENITIHRPDLWLSRRFQLRSVSGQKVPFQIPQ